MRSLAATCEAVAPQQCEYEEDGFLIADGVAVDEADEEYEPRST